MFLVRFLSENIYNYPCGVIVLYSFTITFTQDYRQAQRNSYRVKYACEELSATAATFYSREQYSEGYIIFDTKQGINAVKDQITNLLSVDADGNPIDNSYWINTLHYMIYFYDDSLILKVYKDGEFIDFEPFSYPYYHKDRWIEYDTVIKDPTVAVTINARTSGFRFNLFGNLAGIIRCASHAWEER